ncbi:ARM repeat-containing protein [Viridothelium virens]|uniref:ARM repeat-containing protein n=1 Tax=Viridothelium virens TaxID=1048519 RepID=A0A6A6GXD9_VIRVR|nr:ARM repeat-containing protein [Viridothelium virens]
MNSAFELPAEANPLTENLLLHALKSAASNDVHQLQTGTKQLQQWETRKGYYPHLQSIFLDKHLPREVRYLAVIQLKNGIDKYWRKAATNAVNKEDREAVRVRLLPSGTREADHQLALQNALVIAKITKFEYPNDWPDEVTTIIELLRASAHPNSPSLQLPRTLLILLQIVKELTSGRTPRIRATVQSLTPEIFRVVAPIYIDKLHSWLSFLQHGGDDEGGALQDIEHSLLALKVIRRLLIAGYEFPNRENDVQSFWTITRDHFGTLLQVAAQGASSLTQDAIVAIQKHLMQLAKYHVEMAQAHPFAFVHMHESLNLVQVYWNLAAEYSKIFASTTYSMKDAGISMDEDPRKTFQERLCLKGLLITRACLKMVFNPAPSIKYKQPQEKEERAQATEIVKSQLLTSDFVKELMETVVTRFFVIRASDLREWEEDPEEWESRQEGEGDSFEFSVRPCAEKLFLDLAINFKDLLVPPLLDVFYAISSPDHDNLGLKDSVYTAIGLAAPVSYQALDFDSFLASTLVPESQKQQPGYNILRRRIAILLAQWISVKISQSSRPAVYSIFRYFLSKEDSLNDGVVRITAARQFKAIADEWEFDASHFLPYASDVLSSLMDLIESVELAETKLALLETVSALVERMGQHISPYADEIVSLLPRLWEQSGEENIMKQAILTILARLVSSMKAESRKYHLMALPIIKGALEPDSETRVYLLEDALDLLANILEQTDQPTPQALLGIVPYLLKVLDLGTDTLRKALEIVESYFLFLPSEMLHDSLRLPLIHSLDSLLGSLKADGNGVLTHLFEVIILQAESIAGERAVEITVTDLLNSYFLPNLLNGLHSSYLAHCTTGPLARESLVDGAIETDYFTMLSRLMIASTRITLTAIEPARSVSNTSKARPSNAAEAPEPFEKTMSWLLEEWFSHFPDIPSLPVRKLHCLALTNLLATTQPFILNRLQDLMTVWTSVIIELRTSDESKDVKSDSLVYDPTLIHSNYTMEDGQSMPEAPEEARRRALEGRDPVHKYNTVEFVAGRLSEVIANVGGIETFREQWLVNVDVEVVRAFGELGVL